MTAAGALLHGLRSHREALKSGTCLTDAVRSSLGLGEVARVPEQLQEDNRVGCAEGDPSLHRPHSTSRRDLLYGTRSSRVPLRVCRGGAGLRPPTCHACMQYTTRAEALKRKE